MEKLNENSDEFNPNGVNLQEGNSRIQIVEDFDLLASDDLPMAKETEDASHYLSFGSYTMCPRKGLSVELEEGQGDKKKTIKYHLCSPFEIVGACRDANGHDWAKALRFLDRDKRLHVVNIPDALLHGEVSALCSTLAREGLSISLAKRNHLAAYLNEATPRGRVTMVDRTGWHDIGGHRGFVLPMGTIGSCGREAVVLDKVVTGPYEVRGSLPEWQEKVAVPAGEHLLGVFALSIGLSGPLLRLAEMDGFGINIYGPSSMGKSTVLSLAASVYGRGGSPGYVRAWRATANGLEGAAASASDTLLVLDELGVVEAREAAPAVYGLANGTGKARSRRDGSLREPKSWRVVTLSSGELPIGAKLAEDRNRRARAGQMVRMLDVHVDRGMGCGAFDHAGPDGDAGKLSNSFKAAATGAYGMAGPAFIRALINEDVDGVAVHAMVAEFVKKNVPAGADGQVSRAAEKFGLIAAAGELATQLGVTLWRDDAAREAAEWAFYQWVEGRGGAEPFEVQQAIEAVRQMIVMHGEARFEAIGSGPDARVVQNRLGWRKGHGSDREWWIPPETWKSEICSGLDPKFVAQTLSERGFLRMPKDRGFQCRVNIGGEQRPRAYVVLGGILDGGDDAG